MQSAVTLQFRFELSTSGAPNRIQVCYKDAAIDPVAASQPELTTVRWRDDPVNQSENALLGAMFFDAFAFGVHYDYVVQSADHWVYEGTGLQAGDTIPGLVGCEYDNVWDNFLTPPGLVILPSSPIPYNYLVQQAVIYTAPSGAIAFNASTIYWSWALDDNLPGTDDIPVDYIVQRITANVLNRMIGETPIPPTLIPPEQTAPSGVMSDPRPVFNWHRVPGVPFYEIIVEGSSGIVHQHVYDAPSTCGDLECGIWPDMTLSDGVYTRWVAAIDGTGYVPWSEGMTFSIGRPEAGLTVTGMP
jgi:hypothetical protein